MLRHVRLDEQRRLLRVDATGDEQRGRLNRAAAQHRGLLPHGDRVLVDHAIKCVDIATILHVHKVAQRAEIVASVSTPDG